MGLSNFLYCEGNCPFLDFFSNSKEAMFITSQEGVFLDVNPSMDKLLGYRLGELRGAPVGSIYVSEEDRMKYRDNIESEGVVHDYQLPLRKKDGSIIFCLVDAILWRDADKKPGFYGIVRSRHSIIKSFQSYFNKLKNEQNLLKEERKRLVSDTMVLNRYITDDLLDYIQRTGDNPLNTTRRKSTILSFQIRNAVSLAEALQPEDFASFVSDLFTDIMDLIYGQKGSVNKILGDSLIATFGCPLLTGDEALNAVNAAVMIQDYLKTFNDVRPGFLKEKAEAGIGISTGPVVAGVIGSVRRQEYMVLGDPVNVAVELGGLSEKYQCGILLDDNTFEDIGGGVRCREVFKGQINKRKSELTVYTAAPA